MPLNFEQMIQYNDTNTADLPNEETELNGLLYPSLALKPCDCIAYDFVDIFGTRPVDLHCWGFLLSSYHGL